MMDKEAAIEAARPLVKQMMSDKLTDEELDKVVNVAADIMYQALSTALLLAADMNKQQEAVQICEGAQDEDKKLGN